MIVKTTPNDTATERVQSLRERILAACSTICLERARFYTEAFSANEDKPIVIKRALAIRDTLRGMSIFIEPGDLIVGNQASKLRAAPIFPEYAVEWILKEIDEFDKRPGDKFFIQENEKEELLELCSYWQGKTTLSRGRCLMGETLREIHKTAIIKAEGNLTAGDAHIAINMDRVLKIGLDGYLGEIRKHLNGDLDTSLEQIKQRQFYQAAEIALSAVSEFILRFSRLAQGLSIEETGRGRKEELIRIAENCERIAGKPPQTFYQALQLTYFLQLVLQIESNGHSLSLGRLDQYLFPFYQRDRESGELSDESAIELLENTWVKLLSINKIRPWSHTRYSAGGPLYQNVTIGGTDSEGRDAVNPLSYLILRSVAEMRLTQPNLSVRYHSNISEDFLLRCVEVIEKGFGMPAFNNDEIVVPELIKLGVSPEDAHDYSAIGCIEIAVPGKWGYRCTGKHFINFMRVFLAALNNGVDPVSGKQFCEGTGNLNGFDTFQDVLRAWEKQIRYYAKAGIAIDAAVDVVLEENAPDILCSVFVDDCLERGKTIHEGGAVYDFVSGLQVGIANLGNSLAAIKKLVFDEKVIGAEELMHHLESNFEGENGEKIRLKLVNAAPKYGNDDEYVDLLIRDAYMYFLDEIAKYRTIRHGRGPIGCRYYGGTSSISANVPSGAVVPATPDGRKAWVPLAEGSSPASGTDVTGPTAVFNSIARLPTDKILGGVLLNQKLTPDMIKPIANKQKLIALLRGFFNDLKGWHVQYNIVDRETLLKAQKEPEKYRDLVVRVAGYSAFFTTLSPDTQNDIIARTEQKL
jgi:formate C-acetyltransferase